jgi:protein-serine/threonine kinase
LEGIEGLIGVADEWQTQARAMPDSQEAEMSLPFIGYTYKAFNAFQTS